MKSHMLIILFLFSASMSNGQTTHKKIPKTHQRIYSEVGGFNGRACAAFPYGLASACYHGKYGFIDTSGNERIKCQYKYVSEFKFGKAMVAKGGGYYNEGIIDTTGKEIIPCKYLFLKRSHPCFGVTTPDLDKDFIVEQKGGYGKIYNDGTVAFPCIYSNEIEFENGYATVGIHGKYGIINEQGKVIIPLKYLRDFNNFHEGLVGLGKKNDSGRYVFGFLDTLNQEVVPFEYDGAEYFSEGLAAVCKGKLWGYINKKGEVVINYQFDEAGEFENGYAFVKHNKKWGLINKKGTLKLPFIYKDNYGKVVDGLIPARDSTYKFGVVDTNNNIVVPFKYDWVCSFSDNRASVKKSDAEGYINEKGEEIIPCQFKFAGRFKNGIADVWSANRNMNDNPEQIDTIGNFINKQNDKQHFVDVMYFLDGIALVKNYDGKWGFIDKSGHEIIACQFDNAGHFSAGIAPVKKGGKWFFIHKDGSIAINDSFDEVITLFNKGKLIAVKNGKYGMIDTMGNVVLPFEFNYLGEFHYGLAPAQIGEHFGYINPQGKMRFKSRDKTLPFSEGVGAINDSLCTYFIDTMGNTLFRLRGTQQYRPFSEGLVQLLDDDNVIYVNRYGKTVLQLIKCEQAYNFDHGFAIAGKTRRNSSGLGMINKRGQWIIPPIYSSLSNFTKEGIAEAKLNGRIGYINKRNQVVIPFTYEQAGAITDDKDPWIPVMKNGQWQYVDKHGKKVLGLQ